MQECGDFGPSLVLAVDGGCDRSVSTLHVILCGSVSVSVSAILCPALGLRSASKLHCIA
jgi:hypothetical protein